MMFKRIIIVVLVLVVLILCRMQLTVHHNTAYEKQLMKEIDAHYSTHNIQYVNRYSQYLIFMDLEYLVVLDKNYQEVFKESRETIYRMDSDFDILYKQNMVMYEKAHVKDKQLIYDYYDIHTGEKISSLVLGG